MNARHFDSLGELQPMLPKSILAKTNSLPEISQQKKESVKILGQLAVLYVLLHQLM